MKRLAIFLYGLVSYTLSLGIFAYTAGFLGNFWVPKPIDAPSVGSTGEAILVNTLLLGLFALQHSVMARQGFKRWLTRFIPEEAERSTYVLLSNMAFILLFWQWQPMGGVIWNVQSPVARASLYALFAAGWVLLLLATFLINHFDLFGMRQVWLQLRGKSYSSLKFSTPVLYRFVRHPLYVGWLLIFWSAPTMTAAHLLFASVTTVYILLAIRWEERDLLALHGPDYAEYRRRVPMLIPAVGKRRAQATTTVLRPTTGA